MHPHVTNTCHHEYNATRFVGSHLTGRAFAFINVLRESYWNISAIHEGCVDSETRQLFRMSKNSHKYVNVRVLSLRFPHSLPDALRTIFTARLETYSTLTG